MAGTNAEMLEAVRQVCDGFIAPDNVEGIMWSDASQITDHECREVFALAIYETRLRRERRPKAQRKALKLLRSMLTPLQRAQLRQNAFIGVVGSLGGHYRLYPYTGGAWAVERHGSRWFGVRSFCLHDEKCECPNADSTVAHLLLLLTDEAEFLRLANKTERRNDEWNPDYLRRMRQARLARAAQQAN